MSSPPRFREFATLTDVERARDFMRQGLGLDEAAEQLGVTRAALDRSLWLYIGRHVAPLTNSPGGANG